MNPLNAVLLFTITIPLPQGTTLLVPSHSPIIVDTEELIAYASGYHFSIRSNEFRLVN